MTRPSWCRHDIQVLQSLFSITVCNDDRQKKSKKKKYLKQKQLLTWNDLTFSITLKGLSYCKTKRNIAGITFKRLYDTKPCFTDQSIFEYTDHLFLSCDMKLYSQNYFTNANCQQAFTNTGPFLWTTVMFQFDCGLFVQTCCWGKWTSCHDFATLLISTGPLSEKKDISWAKEPESCSLDKRRWHPITNLISEKLLYKVIGRSILSSSFYLVSFLLDNTLLCS